MGKDDKFIQFGAILLVCSGFKDLRTGKGTEFCNVLARPKVGPVVRLNFFGYRYAELVRITGKAMLEGAQLEVIGKLTGVYDEKPDITVETLKVRGMDYWVDLVM
jgi:hypothetical protein